MVAPRRALRFGVGGIVRAIARRIDQAYREDSPENRTFVESAKVPTDERAVHCRRHEKSSESKLRFGL